MFSTCARCSSRSRIAAASTSPPHAKTVRSEDLNRRRQLVNLAVALFAMCPVALQGLRPPPSLRAGSPRLRHVHRCGPPAQGGVVGNRESETKQADDGADQAFG